MRNNQNSFGIICLIAVLVIITVGGMGLVIYRSSHKIQRSSLTEAHDSHALMTVTYSGGLCNGPCNHPAYNLYDDGKFEGSKKLSSSEVSELKNIINTTDFLKYGPNPHPQCQSFVDGFDQVLLFPQKYGDKSFTTCMLNIPGDDPAFSYINKLIESHSIQRN